MVALSVPGRGERREKGKKEREEIHYYMYDVIQSHTNQKYHVSLLVRVRVQLVAVKKSLCSVSVLRCVHSYVRCMVLTTLGLAKPRAQALIMWGRKREPGTYCLRLQIFPRKFDAL